MMAVQKYKYPIKIHSTWIVSFEISLQWSQSPFREFKLKFQRTVSLKLSNLGYAQEYFIRHPRRNLIT